MRADPTLDNVLNLATLHSVRRRELHPEMLDFLPFDHPDATHSRRDLRVINGLMGNPRWFAQTLPSLIAPGDRVLELGAGLGELGQSLAARGVNTDGLDLRPAPVGLPARRRWHQADLVTFAGYADYSVVFGNLILHQFTTNQLAQVGAALRKTGRLIVAAEPVRRRASQRLLAAIAPVFGFNHVTRHDGRVSIASGFIGDELPELLGLREPEWRWRCHTTVFGSYRMVARRS